MTKYITALFLFLTYSSFSTELFFENKSNQIIATKDPKNTIGLLLNNEFYKEILQKKKDNYLIRIPFFNESIELDLQKQKIFSEGLKTVSKTREGDELLDIIPNILSYKIIYQGNSIGILNFFNKEVVGFFTFNQKKYEIAKFKNSYILFEAYNSINSSTFTCAVDDQSSSIVLTNNNIESIITPKCIELALDIDYYTRQTFSNDQETTNWALAIISGVSQIYEVEFNTGITVVHVQIWNTADPYDTPTLNGNAGAMLNELGNYWNTNNGSINRDLVHLLSKRTNTGTGGIAWVGVLCSSSSGYAFSSYLNNDTTYSFPNPSYTWNLKVVAHEIGHNIGSAHTHACNWAPDPAFGFSGGGIDDCGVVSGSSNACSPPAPSPPGGIGTIMSYCHVGGSGVILDFHDIVVSQALTPGINSASCVTTCDYYGCTDPTAFNYDPNATVDDGSCISVVFGCTDTAAANYNPNANTDDGNCTYCASFTFDVSDISCDGANDGSIDMLVQLGTPPAVLSYSWVGPNGFSSNTEDISNLQQGSYTVTVSDASGCVESITLSITNPMPISIDSSTVSHVSCFNSSDGSIALHLNGGTLPYNYNWGGANPSALIAGTYTIHVTDINNCPSASTMITITEPPALSSSTITTDISCFGQGDGSINLTVTGGIANYTYQWHGPNAFFNTNEDISSLEAGTYTVLVTDANGCTNILNPIIIEPTPLIASSSATDASCNGGTDGSINLTLIGGTQPYFYNWNTGAISQNLTNISSGVYSVDIIDVNGCIVPTITFTINAPLPSTIITQVTSLDCYGINTGMIDLSYNPAIGINQYSYSWTGPNGFTAISEDITNLFSGAYTLNITENSCVITNTYFVSEPDSFTILEDVQNVSCFDSIDGSVLLYISGGTPTYTTDWNGVNPQILASGTYSYTITDNNNCTFSDTVSVSQPDTFNINYNTTDVSCFNGFNGSVLININGGTSPYNISWQNANPLQLNYGYHHFTIVDDNNCIYSDSVFINQPSAINIIEDVGDVMCHGSNSGSASLLINGGTPPYNINWHGVNNLALQSGNYLYDVIDANNCVVSGIFSVQEPSPIIVSHAILPSTCSESINGSVGISINGGISPYIENWFGNNPQALSSGLYNYIVIDSNGCVDSNQVFVPSISNISTNNTINHVSCYGFCDGNINLAIINGAPPYMVNWFGNQSDSLCEGEYSYQVIDSLGCIFEDTVNIEMPQPITLNIIQNGSLLEAIASGGTPLYNYYWWNASGNLGNNQSITFNSPGNYYCVVVDVSNCNSDTASIYINETLISDFLFENIHLFPNPFSQDLTIKLPLIYENVELSLYNVLGELIESNEYKNIKQIQIDRGSLASGSYYISFKIRNSLIRKKVIIR